MKNRAYNIILLVCIVIVAFPGLAIAGTEGGTSCARPSNIYLFGLLSVLILIIVAATSNILVFWKAAQRSIGWGLGVFFVPLVALLYSWLHRRHHPKLSMIHISACSLLIVLLVALIVSTVDWLEDVQGDYISDPEVHMTCASLLDTAKSRL